MPGMLCTLKENGREYYEHAYASKSDSLDGMEKFLERQVQKYIRQNQHPWVMKLSANEEEGASSG